jgi:hypothetical protein
MPLTSTGRSGCDSSTGSLCGFPYAPLHKARHGVGIAHVADMHLDAVADVRDVAPVAAVLRNQAVDDGDLCAGGDQAPRYVRADEAEPACDEDVRGNEAGAHGFSASTA